MTKFISILVLILAINLLSGCSTFPAHAGKELSRDTELNWQYLNAANGLAAMANPECLNGKLPAVAGLVVKEDTSKGEIVGYYAINAFVHYSLSKLFYRYAPDRFWKAWNFSTQGMAVWDMTARFKNC